MKFLSAGPAFIDTVDSLKKEFSSDSSNTLVVLGAYHFSAMLGKQFSELRECYKTDKIVLFNQEQLHARQRDFCRNEYLYLDSKQLKIYLEGKL